MPSLAGFEVLPSGLSKLRSTLVIRTKGRKWCPLYPRYKRCASDSPYSNSRQVPVVEWTSYTHMSKRPRKCSMLGGMFSVQHDGACSHAQTSPRRSPPWVHGVHSSPS
eukprot:1484842-Amphidinium_carterae.3